MSEYTPLTLAQRCRIHADKMQDEGWYVTANVLWAAADELEVLLRERDQYSAALDELKK